MSTEPAPIAYSRGRNTRDNHPKQRVAPDFAAFVDALDHDRAEDKSTAGFFCAPVNGRRCAERASLRRFLALDLDRVDAGVLPNLRLWLARFSGCGWPTHRSTPEAPRERAVIELSREVDRAEGIAVCGVLARDLNAKFGAAIEVDPSTHNAEQPVFLPPADVALARFLGDPLDVDAYLADAAVLPDLAPQAKPAPAPGAMVVEPGRHAHLTRLFGTLNRKGAALETVVAALVAENAARCSPPLAEADVRKMAAGMALRYADEKPRDVPTPDETGAVALSEDALALAFVHEHLDSFKWSPGLGWLANRGDHWSADDKLERFAAVRLICRRAAIAAPDDGMRLSTAKFVAAVLTLAQADPHIVLAASAWDAEAFALNTPGQIVDLQTGRMRDRAPTRDFMTQITRVAPEDVACPLWMRFVNAVFLGDAKVIEFVQRLLGYLCSADRSEQKLFFFYGLGANGKSTLIDLVTWILGTYALKLPATVLMQANVDRHPTELAQLRGKRLAVSSELDEGQFWAESRIKELTGDEVLTARFMRQDFFEFPMTQTHVIVGNYKPRLRGGDAALARRFVLVPFMAKFEGSQRDPDMLAKLRAEAPAILNWMIEGAVKWRRNGLAIPDSVTAASREYLAENDDVPLWIGECCAMDVDSRTRASDMYESLSHWIKARGQHPPSMRLFGDRMAVIPGLTKARSGGIQ